jgi:hypothetical protein
MTPFTRALTMSAPVVRTVAIATLMGATFLAGPLIPARADSAIAPPVQLVQNSTAKDATSTKGETLEERITNLHATLKITPDEDSKWNAVAQAMRENASKMDKLAADKRTKAPQSMTAVDDLMTYQDFAQAHVDGLKTLTSAFKALYDTMPDAQKKEADAAFRNFGRERAPSRG